MTTTATSPAAHEAVNTMRAALAAVGAAARVHARDLGSGREIGLEEDEPVTLASVFKIPVLLELARQAAAGERALTDRAPAGLSVMLDAAELSLRDLATLMITISDNTATDVCMEVVGLDRIDATLRGLGLTSTRLVADCATLLDRMAVELGFDDAVHLSSFDLGTAPPERVLEVTSALQNAGAVNAVDTNVGTARETTRLLELIWNDEAGPPEACAEVRRILALQVFRDRLASGFPEGVKVSSKTGTLPLLRNEAGVVAYPDGGRYAVAVFARASRPDLRQPEQDRVIGTVARIAVDFLRSDPSPA